MEQKTIDSFNLIVQAAQSAQLSFQQHSAIQEALKHIAEELKNWSESKAVKAE